MSKARTSGTSTCFDVPQEWMIERVRTRQEVVPVMDLDRQAFTMPWTEDMFATALRPGTGLDMFALRSARDHTLAGYVCYRLDHEVLQVATIAVRENLRRCGLGRLLLRYALSQGKFAGAKIATLEVRVSNIAAQKLYREVGFLAIDVRRCYYESPVEDAVTYSLPL